MIQGGFRRRRRGRFHGFLLVQDFIGVDHPLRSVVFPFGALSRDDAVEDSGTDDFRQDLQDLQDSQDSQD
jgi:hypothetical protein